MPDDPEAARRRAVVRLSTLAEQGQERDLDGTNVEERFADDVAARARCLGLHGEAR